MTTLKFIMPGQETPSRVLLPLSVMMKQKCVLSIHRLNWHMYNRYEKKDNSVDQQYDSRDDSDISVFYLILSLLTQCNVARTSI